MQDHVEGHKQECRQSRVFWRVDRVGYMQWTMLEAVCDERNVKIQDKVT